MAEVDRLTTLYQWSEAMTAAGDSVKEKHEEDYKKIIDYVKTSENLKERILAAQQIARFYKFFPEHQDTAFDSIVDLCESPDVDVRKHATMVMISICRGSKQVVSKAADILIQLYQTNQPSEVNLITQSLTTLLDLNITEFLKSFFANFEDGSELVRERALKFLTTSINDVNESQLTREIEEQLLNYTKKAMQDVNKDEFISFIKILSKLKISKTSVGQATLVSTIRAQAEMDKDFNPNDSDTLDKFLLCARQTQPFLSIYNRASEYINYICLKVLPHLKELTPSGTDLVVLQVLAEMSPHIIIDDVPALINLDECHKNVYKKLMEFLPVPEINLEPVAAAVDAPSTATAAAAAIATAATAAPEKSQSEENDSKESEDKAGQNGENGAAATATTTTTETAPTATDNNNKLQETDFQFTHIEYLMYTLMQLSRLKPELHTDSMQVESRKQLQHLSNGCKKYTDALERQPKSGAGGQDLRGVALRTTKNISAMIIGLFRRPADFKVVSAIHLSCKPIAVAPSQQAAIKKPQQQQQKFHQDNRNKRPYQDYGFNNRKRFRNFTRR